jgi:Tfp pilus assembly protein PilV
MRLRLRRGFTLVELVIAVLLIDVGLLALVAGSAVVIKRDNELRMRAAAARAGANRLQLLSLGTCGSIMGSTTDRGITENWTAAARADGFRDLSDSVSYRFSGIERRVVLRTRAPC